MSPKYGVGMKMNPLRRLCVLFAVYVTLQGASSASHYTARPDRLPTWRLLPEPESDAERGEEGRAMAIQRSAYFGGSPERLVDDDVAWSDHPAAGWKMAARFSPSASRHVRAVGDAGRPGWFYPGVRIAGKKRVRVRANPADRAVPGPFLSEKTRLKFLNALRRFEETKDTSRTPYPDLGLGASRRLNAPDVNTAADKGTALSIGLELRTLTEMLQTHRKQHGTMHDLHQKLIDIG